MEAAMPLDPGSDPFLALTQRFAAMDAQQEVEHQRGKAVLRNGRAAVSRLKQTAERTVSGDTPVPSKTKLCIKAFTQSDIDRADAIDDAQEKANADRNLPVTQVLDPSEVRARLDAAAAAATDE